MSIKASLEVILHVENFKNIDLFHFGLYCLRGRFYRMDVTKKNVTQKNDVFY